MLFGVLGTICVWRPDGATVPLVGERQRTLLAALLANAGEPVSADRLADLLWREEQPDNPAAALQSQVHRLRRVLAPLADAGVEVLTRPPGYLLRVDPDDLDASRFDALLDQARAVADEDAAAAVELLTRAISLWRGDAYDEFAGTDVAQVDAVRLDEARMVAQELRADALLRLGRDAEVVSALEPFVLTHPLREGARMTLMRALYTLGRHADALARYADYRRRLAEELGLEPSAAMQRLETQILRQEVPTIATAVPQQRPAPATGVTFDQLHARFVTDRHGHRIAYATVGDGLPVVACPGWISSLDVIASGRDPRSTMLQRLAARCRLTMYDRAGSGLSPDAPDDLSLEASVDELEAVVDAVGAPVALFAMSQAGPVAVAMAARRPDAVTSLVLFGTYADGPAVFTNEPYKQSVLAMVRAHWGTGARVIAELYRPGTTDEGARHFAQAMRDSADAEVAAAYLQALYDADVTSVLPTVSTPALVLHYRRDRVIPFAGGRQLAGGLPNASFLPLEGTFHLPDAADVPRIVTAVSEFVQLHAGSSAPVAQAAASS